MGYFYDWLEERWTPLDHGRVLTRQERRLIERRRGLIEDLITQIKDDGVHDGVIGLYFGLLARALVASDAILIQAYSEQVAKLTGYGKDSRKPSSTGLARKGAS